MRPSRTSTSSPRDAFLLYAGDFDPSGEDIDRDFVARLRAIAVYSLRPL